MSNERDKIIAKIKKCLALSASSNEHEAAAALRQAKKLMEQYSISDLDMAAAEAGEKRARSGATQNPANWEAVIAAKVADAFACRVIFATNRMKRCGEWRFIGAGAMPEVAEYAFRVLHRQCKTARAEHIKSKLKRCKPAIKVRRADLFCDGWVQAVVGLIASFAGGEVNCAAVDAYMANNYSNLVDLKARDRNDGRNLRDHEYDDLYSGRCSGRDAQLNRGIGGAEERKALQ